MNKASGIVATLGIDLAKRIFALHGVDASGKTVLRRMVHRAELLKTIANLPPCLIGLEACSGAHEWARRFQGFHHTVRLIAPTFVTPFRRSGKNDHNDAEAICEAVGRPNIRFVPVKSREQQAVLTLHRVRQGLVEERTALINRIRGLMTEFGFVFATRTGGLRAGIHDAIEQLPLLAAQGIRDLLDHLQSLTERVARYDSQFRELARQDERARRVMTVPGVGPITALGVTATLGDAREFKNGRQLAAWLGLTPKQHSSGGKTRLSGITKHGDDYLRTLLILGARATMQHATRRAHTRLDRWAVSVSERRGYHKAVVALAAKNARIIWALLVSQKEFEVGAAAAA